MSPLLVPMLGDALRAILDRTLPDPAARREAEAKLRELERDGTFADRAGLAVQLAQAEANKADAGAGIFRAGWRPFAGWVCGAALAVQFVAGPLLEWGAAATGHPVPPLPKLDAVLWELLAAMLGLGGLRTVEKIKGRT